MKQISAILFSLFLSTTWGQNILFVNDNDYILENTDTVLFAMQNSNYGTFDYYNVADSIANPTIQLLSNYDLVIWYASTDGFGLKLWNNGTSGEAGLVDYLLNGGRLWLVGSDLLYGAGYSTPQSFSSGDFAFDYMGLTSYDTQSYGDDGNTGVAELNSISGSPNYFPSTLSWIFPTAWWVDGVTPRSGSIDLYEMGPSTYALYQSICMTHFKDADANVLSTLFDPALLSSYALRRSFIENSIFYLLNFDLGITNRARDVFHVFPNPTSDDLKIIRSNTGESIYFMSNVNGERVKAGHLSKNNSSISLAELASGIYFLHLDGAVQKIMKY